MTIFDFEEFMRRVGTEVMDKYFASKGRDTMKALQARVIADKENFRLASGESIPTGFASTASYHALYIIIFGDPPAGVSFVLDNALSELNEKTDLHWVKHNPDVSPQSREVKKAAMIFYRPEIYPTPEEALDAVTANNEMRACDHKLASFALE